MVRKTSNFAVKGFSFDAFESHDLIYILYTISNET